jgi:hypothetical protein
VTNTPTTTYLIPAEVDQLFRWPRGRAKRLAKEGMIRHIRLPDGDVRFERAAINEILLPRGGNLPIQPMRLVGANA